MIYFLLPVIQLNEKPDLVRSENLIKSNKNLKKGSSIEFKTPLSLV